MKLLICPLKSELKILLEQFKSKEYKFEIKRIGDLSYWNFPQLKLICAVGGRGKAQFAIQTQYLISNITNITQVITFGAGGSLTSTCKTFDLVVGNKCIEHDFKQHFKSEETLPTFQADNKLIAKVNKFKAQNFNVHIGTIASGDEDIIDTKRAQELAIKTGAIAVGWEGAGSARACLFNHIAHIEIRAITDNCQNNVPVDFCKNLPQAIKNGTELILSILRS